jgi:hypothetical protein
VKRAALLLLAVCACTGEIEGTVPEGEMPPPPSGGAFKVLSPDDGESFGRTALTADGRFVAEVGFTAEAPAGSSVEWRVGDAAIGSGLDVVSQFPDEGSVTAVAVAKDGSGKEIGRKEVRFQIAGAPPAACLDRLQMLGVNFTPGPAAQGIAIPVTVTLPLNGIRYRQGAVTMREKHFMDCELALSLYRAAILWKALDITIVRDYGIYNYRCINQSVEPPCPGSKLSQHSFGYAIDIAGFETSDGTYYSVNDDWVIDPDAERTCEAETVAGKDQWLHDLVCDLFTNRIFRILLTPNYNDAHRNHFHVDLTPGSNSITKESGTVLRGDEH